MPERNIPASVNQALRKRASQRKISLNQLIVEELAGVTGGVQNKKYRSLAGIAGKWQADAEFDRIMEAQREIEPDMWQ